MNDNGPRIADAIGPGGIVAWFFLHISQINSILQTVLLIASIGATLAAWRYHYKKSQSGGRRK